MAGSTPQKADRLAELFADNYAAFAEGRLDELDNRIV
jgi:hypothetical protein